MFNGAKCYGYLGGFYYAKNRFYVTCNKIALKHYILRITFLGQKLPNGESTRHKKAAINLWPRGFAFCCNGD